MELLRRRMNSHYELYNALEILHMDKVVVNQIVVVQV